MATTTAIGDVDIHHRHYLGIRFCERRMHTGPRICDILYDPLTAVVEAHTAWPITTATTSTVSNNRDHEMNSTFANIQLVYGQNLPSTNLREFPTGHSSNLQYISGPCRHLYVKHIFLLRVRLSSTIPIKPLFDRAIVLADADIDAMHLHGTGDFSAAIFTFLNKSWHTHIPGTLKNSQRTGASVKSYTHATKYKTIAPPRRQLALRIHTIVFKITIHQTH